MRFAFPHEIRGADGKMRIGYATSPTPQGPFDDRGVRRHPGRFQQLQHAAHVVEERRASGGELVGVVDEQRGAVAEQRADLEPALAQLAAAATRMSMLAKVAFSLIVPVAWSTSLLTRTRAPSARTRPSEERRLRISRKVLTLAP